MLPFSGRVLFDNSTVEDVCFRAALFASRPASVAQWRERPLAEREAPGSSPGGGAHSLVVQPAGHAALDRTIEVRILARELRRRTRLGDHRRWVARVGTGWRLFTRSWPNRQRHRPEEPEVRVRVPPSVLFSPLWPNWQRRPVQDREVQGSNPWGGTVLEGWRNRYRARFENGGQGHTCEGSNPSPSATSVFVRPLRPRVRSRGPQPREAGSSPAGATYAKRSRGARPSPSVSYAEDRGFESHLRHLFPCGPTPLLPV